MTELETALMMELDMIRAENRRLLSRVRELQDELKTRDVVKVPQPALVAKPKKKKLITDDEYPHIGVPSPVPVPWLVFDRETKELLAEPEQKTRGAHEAWANSLVNRPFGMCLVVQREDFEKSEGALRKKRGSNGKAR